MTAPPVGLTLTRTVSEGGIPLFSGDDIVVRDKSSKNFDGALPTKDTVWFGPTTFEVATDSYEIIEYVNFGAEGQTYIVKRKSDEKQFVCKFCSQKNSSEVTLLQRMPRKLVAHPNIIKYEMIIRDVADIFNEWAQHIVFMERIPNGELFDVLASAEPSVAGKPLSEGTKIRIVHDIVSGMAEMYRFGVTHRDLKPENLLINENGSIVIIDLGHAKKAEAAGGLSRATTANPYGTAAFNAPEVTGGKEYDCEKSDVWSVGTIAFYLHAKLPAFKAGGGVGDWNDCADGNAKLWKKIESCGFYPQFNESLKAFINTLWRVEPSERPTFSELELAMNGDEEAKQKFPGLEWLTQQANDQNEFIEELRKSLPGKTFNAPAAVAAKRW